MTTFLKRRSMTGMLGEANSAFLREVVWLDKPHVGARMTLHAGETYHMIAVANGALTSHGEKASVTGAVVANAALEGEGTVSRVSN